MLTGLVELTNGLKEIASISQKAISTNITLASFLLGFGGISILLQVLSITSKSDLSIKPYLIGKLLQGFFAACYTYILATKCSFFQLDLVCVSNNLSSNLAIPTASSNGITYAIFLLFFICFLYSIYFTKKRKKADIS